LVHAGIRQTRPREPIASTLCFPSLRGRRPDHNTRVNAVHADALMVELTDWRQIVALYDQLFAVAPTPVVALNRAIAIGEVHGPAAALALLDQLDLDSYYPFHATRADLLGRLGRTSEAAAAYQRAAALAPTKAERDFLGRGGRASRSANR
jgi:RNA polymerase sigma-70 factor (ECF subfamily)